MAQNSLEKEKSEHSLILFCTKTRKSSHSLINDLPYAKRLSWDNVKNWLKEVYTLQGQ